MPGSALGRGGGLSPVGRGRAGDLRLVPRRAPPDCFPAQSCQPAQASCGSVRLSRRMGGGERRGRFAPLPSHAFSETHWLPSFEASPGWASAHAIGPRLSRRNAPFPVGPAPLLAAPFPSFLFFFPLFTMIFFFPRPWEAAAAAVFWFCLSFPGSRGGVRLLTVLLLGAILTWESLSVESPEWSKRSRRVTGSQCTSDLIGMIPSTQSGFLLRGSL